MKKSLILFLLLGIILIKTFMPVVSAINPEDSLDDVEERMENLQDTIEEYSDKDAWEEKWDYLGNEWKNILLKNKVIFALDSFFTKISIVFHILFAQPYSMSLILLGIIFLWLFVFLDSGNLIRAWGIVGEGLFPYLASFVLAVAIAWTTAFENIIILLGRLAFAPEHWWTRTLTIVFIILGFVVLQYLSRLMSGLLKGRKEDLKKRATELAQNSIQKFAEKMGKGSSQEQNQKSLHLQEGQQAVIKIMLKL
jgi:hypothetical protein